MTLQFLGFKSSDGHIVKQTCCTDAAGRAAQWITKFIDGATQADFKITSFGFEIVAQTPHGEERMYFTDRAGSRTLKRVNGAVTEVEPDVSTLADLKRLHRVGLMPNHIHHFAASTLSRH